MSTQGRVPPYEFVCNQLYFIVCKTKREKNKHCHELLLTVVIRNTFRRFHFCQPCETYYQFLRTYRKTYVLLDPNQLLFQVKLKTSYHKLGYNCTDRCIDIKHSNYLTVLFQKFYQRRALTELNKNHIQFRLLASMNG